MIFLIIFIGYIEISLQKTNSYIKKLGGLKQKFRILLEYHLLIQK